MFIIGGNQAVCPRGFICVNNYNLLLILIAVIICIYIVNKQIYLSVYNKMLESKLGDDQGSNLNAKDFGITNPPTITLDKDKFDGYKYDKQQMGAELNQPFNNPTRNNTNLNNNHNNHGQIVDMDRVNF